MAIYEGDNPLIDHIKDLTTDGSSTPSRLSRPDYGLDSLFGLLCSNVTAPLYLYATLKGKFDVWDDILERLPDDYFGPPCLDVGCGRGMVLLKVAQRKSKMKEALRQHAMQASSSSAAIEPAIGIDIFNVADQTGNAPVATYQNAVAMGVTQETVLHTHSFADRLPFLNGVFSLITSCLALHNAKREERLSAIREMARVCAPGGIIKIVDLYGGFEEYSGVLVNEGLKDVHISFAGFRMLYGVIPCQILSASKPA